jgi:hypothetical protein
LKQEQVVAFYSFMSQMGMAAQAIDIVYQLNAQKNLTRRFTSMARRRWNRSRSGRTARRHHPQEPRPKPIG